MLLKGTKAKCKVVYSVEGFVLGRSTSNRKSPSLGRRSIVIGLVVLALIAAIVVFEFSPYGNTNATLNHWQLKVHFFDASTGMNFTAPAGIGINRQYWVNHTLDEFGPRTTSPMTTQDSSGTIYLDFYYPAIFTFGDFFNVWGQRLNSTCVWYYCASPQELVINDSNGGSTYTSGDLVLNAIKGAKPAQNALLSTDMKIMFWDADSNGRWDPSEPIFYDTNNNGTYAANDPTIYSGTGSTTPSLGAKLTFSSYLRFVDTNGDNFWNNAVPAPVMSDGGSHEGCVNRSLGLSNGKDWIIVINAPSVAASFGCLP